jgi:hypothetical protein
VGVSKSSTIPMVSDSSDIEKLAISAKELT